MNPYWCNKAINFNIEIDLSIMVLTTKKNKLMWKVNWFVSALLILSPTEKMGKLNRTS